MIASCCKSRIAVTGLTGALLLSGCATDRQTTIAQGAGIGAAAGAVLGGVLGRNKDSMLAGAALGAALGGGGGYQMASKKAEYAQREDELEAAAKQAQTMARAIRAENEQRATAISALEQSVQRLNTAKLTATERRNLAAENQQKQIALVAGIDERLRQLRGEFARQNTLLAAERKAHAEAAAKVPPANVATTTPTDGFNHISLGVRELQQQQRVLEAARAQLMQIDNRRAY